MGFRPQETLLLVTDDVMRPVAAPFHDAALALGIETLLLTMPAGRKPGEEPPEAIARALESVDLALLITRESLSHTKARRDACRKFGVRIASLPGVDGDRLSRTVEIDYEAMRRHGEALCERFRSGKRVRLTTPAGTDLTFRIDGRMPLIDSGIFTFPGAFGNLPAGEIVLAPIEGSTNGVLVVDGSLDGVGLLSGPARLAFREGVLIACDHPKFEGLLAEAGLDGRQVGEFGIGINPSAEVVGNPVEDDKALGSVHLALGGNLSLGGRVNVPTHLAAVVRAPHLTVDEAEVPVELLLGRLGTAPPPVAEAPPAEPEPAPSAPVSTTVARSLLAGLDTYKQLFENANDPQYILDLESQVFCEANPAFERLTGYTREEILSGKVNAKNIIAQESVDTYERKVSHRRRITSERYTIKLICAGGEKKSVEVSVQRMVLAGREFVVGSLRDRTEHETMQKNLWDKIRDLGNANLRILALTEKIRSIPTVMPLILNAQDEQEILAKAAAMFTDRRGLACTDVTFYLHKDGFLEPIYTTRPKPPRRQDTAKDHRLVKIWRGDLPPSTDGIEVVLPLRAKDQTLGLAVALLDEKERSLLEGNESARKGYQDLLVTFAHMMGIILENRRLYDRVKMQSLVDQLTETYNRRYFDSRIRDEVRRALRYRRELSLVIADVDRFKEVNDTYGHPAGDVVLQEVAGALKKAVRAVDVVCRYGGDEFIMLLPETSCERAVEKAEHLRKMIRTSPLTTVGSGANGIRCTLSLGVASLLPTMAGEEDLLRAADEALYQAKRGGRDRVCVAPVEQGEA